MPLTIDVIIVPVTVTLALRGEKNVAKNEHVELGGMYMKLPNARDGLPARAILTPL